VADPLLDYIREAAGQYKAQEAERRKALQQEAKRAATEQLRATFGADAPVDGVRWRVGSQKDGIEVLATLEGMTLRSIEEDRQPPDVASRGGQVAGIWVLGVPDPDPESDDPNATYTPWLWVTSSAQLVDLLDEGAVDTGSAKAAR